MFGALTRSVLVYALVSCSVTVGVVVAEEAHQGVMATVDDCFNTSVTFIKENNQLIQLAQALAHLPYIFTVDSTDPKVIRSCSAVSMSSTAIKVMYELARNRSSCLAGNLVLDMPKLCLLLASMGYDAIRFLDAVKVAYNNKTCGKKLKSFQINQCAELFIEIFLRVITYMLQHQKHLGGGNGAMADVAAEVADFIAIWRLLSRYTTYFMYTKQINFSVNIQVHEDLEPQGLDKLDEKDLAELTALARAQEGVEDKNMVLGA